MSDNGFVIRIWLTSKFGSFSKSIRYSPGNDPELVTGYQEGLPSASNQNPAPKLVWEPEIHRDDALELCKEIESTPITLIGGDLEYIGLHKKGLEFMKGVLKVSAEWETGRPNNDTLDLDRLWKMVDSKLRM